MRSEVPEEPHAPGEEGRETGVTLREVALQALTRTSGSPLVEGNGVRVLHDAPENYPAWEEAIASARRSVHMEMYIFRPDRWGTRFANLLAARAAAGVQVRILCDWFGCWSTPRRFFGDLLRSGGEMRFFNRPDALDPLVVIRRNHRKVISVDGAVAFVSGLCIADPWMGDQAHGIAPWRDVGVELRGPSVADVEHAFSRSWQEAGGGIPREELPMRESVAAAGSHGVRVIASTPETANVFRMDLLVASLARERLWLMDAYFMANVPYLQALRRAAADGVDVRLLLPSNSDIRWIAAASRARYGTLLDSGVRVFEWRGPMLHAKAAVADSLWTRVGSTNLNAGSWLNNWEMDVAIEDAGIARAMEARYQEDLQNADEIVRAGGAIRMRTVGSRSGAAQRGKGTSAAVPTGQGSGGQVLRGMGNLGATVGAAVAGTRPLESFEFRPLMTFGLTLLVLGAVGFWRPAIVVWPISALLGVLGLQLIARGFAGLLHSSNREA